MKALRLLNLGALAVLGCIAGGVKLVPQSIDLFLQQAGLNTTMIVVLGVVQLASGLFLLHPKTRLWAAIALAITLIVSSASIFMAGRPDLGWYSLVPIAMAGIVIRQSMAPSAAREGLQHPVER
jgi:uncharacterized membrane protein